MLALDRDELPVEVRKSPVFPFFDAVEVFPGRQFILILAGHPARMASHAFSCINEHPVPWHLFPLQGINPAFLMEFRRPEACPMPS